MASKITIHPVDELLPPGRLTLLGIQHVLVMYAGAVAVPLIIGGALRLPKEQMAQLINADLFACGLVTLIQAIGFWRFGILLASIVAVLLNVFFNEIHSFEAAEQESAVASAHGEA